MSDFPAEEPLQVACGAAALRALVRESTTDLRRIDVDQFREWLGGQLPPWRRDPVFVQRERIRDLRRAYPAMRALEREHRRAAAADAQTPAGARLREVEVELRGVKQAIAGLTAALGAADDERRSALAEKLAGFENRRAALAAERDRLAASPERTLLLRLDAELRSLRTESGVDAEEARLDELVRAQGQRAGGAGGGFEETALRAIRSHVLPALGNGPLAVLTGVTLGAARTELDQVIVRGCGDAPVEVLGVVEAKRNPNDVGHGFTRRQENLAWLGRHRGAYDPARHVTRHFPTGHFDRAAVHEQDGERFVFDPTSFRHFRPDEKGLFLAGLFFVTRPAHLVGVSGGALARVRHRAATDERFDLEDDAYLGELLAWCGALAEPAETPDVLGLYAADPELARQVLLIEVA